MQTASWKKNIQFLPVILIFLAGCTLGPRVTPASTENSMIPKPASTEITAFIDQTDGVCGYRMLRPQDWQPSKNECRYYTYQSSADDRLELRVVNYQVMAQQMQGTTIAQYALFEQDPSLDGWSAAVEQNWNSLGVEFNLLETLPNAKVYNLESPNSLELVALAIDQNQPLGIILNARGIYADVPAFKKSGLKSDFIYMVANLKASAYDPEYIEPPID